MKDKNAFFLLQAIGELSEETVAEAKRIRRFSMRRILIAAAVLSAFIFATALTVGIMNVSKEPDQMMNYDNKSSRHQDKPSTPDQTGETVTPPPTEAPTEPTVPTESTEPERSDPPDSTEPSAVSTTPPSDNSGFSGAIRFVPERVGEECPFDGPVHTEELLDAGWRDFHSVTLLTSQEQLTEFCRSIGKEPLHGITPGFRPDGSDPYNWEYYNIIAVANTRVDNRTLDLIELRRDGDSASFWLYFRESVVISNEPLSNITDVKLYLVSKEDCAGVRGFFL